MTTSQNAPFSDKLNSFVTGWYKANKDMFNFTSVDNFDENDIEGTFESHKKIYKETGVIHIWTGCSENTIFGDAKVNHYFRAWHDYIHIVYDLGYSITEESIVCNIQRDMLPSDWNLERDLINAEIIGQAHYFYKNNEFVKNQRDFTSQYLKSSIIALQKQ